MEMRHDSQDELTTRNIKDRFYTLVAILSLFVPTFMSLNLTDSGEFNMNINSISFIAVIFVLILGLILSACLNKEIGVAESFLYLALFLSSIGLTLYVYCSGFTSKEENRKDFMINLTSVCLSILGSVSQITAMFWNSVTKRSQPEETDEETDEEQGRRNVASSENPNNESHSAGDSRFQDISETYHILI